MFKNMFEHTYDAEIGVVGLLRVVGMPSSLPLAHVPLVLRPGETLRQRPLSSLRTVSASPDVACTGERPFRDETIGSLTSLR